MKRPKTVSDWMLYFASIPDELMLLSKARACNCMRFVNMLKEDGLSLDDIEQIFMGLAKCFHEKELAPPKGGVYDLVEMYVDPNVQEMSLPEPMTDFEEPIDNIDIFLNAIERDSQ